MTLPGEIDDFLNATDTTDVAASDERKYVMTIGDASLGLQLFPPDQRHHISGTAPPTSVADHDAKLIDISSTKSKPGRKKAARGRAAQNTESQQSSDTTVTQNESSNTGGDEDGSTAQAESKPSGTKRKAPATTATGRKKKAGSSAPTLTNEAASHDSHETRDMIRFALRQVRARLDFIECMVDDLFPPTHG